MKIHSYTPDGEQENDILSNPVYVRGWPLSWPVSLLFHSGPGSNFPAGLSSLYSPNGSFSYTGGQLELLATGPHVSESD